MVVKLWVRDGSRCKRVSSIYGRIGTTNPNKKHSDGVSVCQSNWMVDVPENKLMVAVAMINDCDERHE